MRFSNGLSRPGAVMMAVAMASFAPAVGQAEVEAPVRFLANAGIASEGETSLFDITIREWTSEEERAELVAALSGEAGASIRETLQAKASKGRIAPRAELGVDLRYAYRIERQGGSTIVLAADRPIDVDEAIDRGVVSRSYETTFVVLELDERGRGSGTMVIGAALEIGPDGRIAFTSASPDPVRLGNVRLAR